MIQTTDWTALMQQLGAEFAGGPPSTTKTTRSSRKTTRRSRQAAHLRRAFLRSLAEAARHMPNCARW